MVTLLYSGNLGIGQELDTILQAMVRLNGDHDLRFLIVGHGKGAANTQKLVRQLQLQNVESNTQKLVRQLQLQNVEFRKPVSLIELPKLLALGDIHLICQKQGTEGLLVPSKIYATLAAGRPSLFVGPENCEVSRIIRESKSGFVVETGDVNGTFEALSKLAGSKSLREEMGANAKNYYQANFGRQKSVEKIVSIIEQVARNNHSFGAIPEKSNYQSK
jgi:colanic acid biosynthesis glycosyl transferase WcaI